MPATEGHEVSLSGFLKAFQSPGHDGQLTCLHGPTQAKNTEPTTIKINCPTQAKGRLEWATRHPPRSAHLRLNPFNFFPTPSIPPRWLLRRPGSGAAR